MAVPISRADAIVLGAIALAVAATGGALLALGGAAAPAWLGEVAPWAVANGWECLGAAAGGECQSFPPAPNEVVSAAAGLTLLAAAGGLLVSAVNQLADSAADKEAE